MKARYLLAGMLAGALVLLLARSVPYATWQPPRTAPEDGAGKRRYRGAVHVHLPDAEEPFLALVAAARQAGLDFILFAANGTFDAAADGREGYYTGSGETLGPDPGASRRPPILVLVGAELPSDRGNLLLVGGQPGGAYPLTRRSARLVRAAVEGGGIALALKPCRQPVAAAAIPSPAHPDPPAGVAGVEAISLAADFTSDLYYPLAEAAILSLLNPAGGLARLAPGHGSGEPPAPGLDWHGGAAPLGGVGLGAGEILGGPFPAGALALSWVTTWVRTDRALGQSPATFAADRDALLGALATGASGAEVSAWGGSHLRVERHLEEDGSRLQALVAPGAASWLVWRRDGQVAGAGPGPARALDSPAPGTWRAEAYRARVDLGLPGEGWLLWGVSSPVQVPAAGSENGGGEEVP